MHTLDMVLAIPILFGAFKGYKNGFIKEFITLISLFLALFLAYKCSSVTGQILVEKELISTQNSYMVSVVLTFLIVIIGLRLIAWLLDKFIKLILLSFVNKIAGLVFGMLKFSLYLVLLVLLFNKVNQFFLWVEPTILDQSILYSYCLNLGNYALSFLKNLSSG